ncbi:hypothetical protein [Telmatospirillum siberiense]|uniref:Uncharacterized protein n=1 Tax=Telmatospirillum siberiense TaxID=382514 RepID=A0A2N3PMZ5_9PROT|nr:hypothetical protein [Telmatospirillum siberiense]PKU21760.1 hypothetical protein CWS72_24920 [Telmatospirillum siberiense]
MSKSTPHSYAAHDALRKAHAAGRVLIYSDARILGRPGSPLYNAFEVFIPPLVLMASSLTLLFAFGLIEWLIALVLVVLYQLYGAPRVVNWRVHRRAVAAVLANPQNLQILWDMGGIALALKDWPEQACVGPKGDWRAFCGEFLVVPETTEF